MECRRTLKCLNVECWNLKDLMDVIHNVVNDLIRSEKIRYSMSWGWVRATVDHRAVVKVLRCEGPR